MAKIKKMPSLAIISGFRGIIDFYVWKGIICVRKWPKKPDRTRSLAVQAGWEAFTWASQNWGSLSPEVQEAYNQMAAGTNLTGRDVFTKSYISKALFILEDKP